MSNTKSEQLASVPDSETSVDYYVTTINDSSPNNADSSKAASDETSPVVVSLDQERSVKVRVRKKSKRRKKKSNLDENGLHVSDDGVIFHSSCSNENSSKLPRRSSSLCERGTYESPNSFSVSTETDVTDPNNSLKSAKKDDHVVRRRNKRKGSLKSSRRQGVFLDDIKVRPANKFRPALSEDNQNHIEKIEEAGKHKHWHSFDCAENPVGGGKKINRQDALATLDLFMIEVEKATSVAKLREGERNKDSNLRKSRSLSELICDKMNGKTPLSAEICTSISPPLHVHKKSLSIDQQSPMSEVFASDHEIALDEISSAKHQQTLKKTFSDELSTDVKISESLRKRSRSKYSSNEQDNLMPNSHSQSSMKKEKDVDYGLNHLNQVCQLLEQIGELRKQKEALIKRVEELERENKFLKSDKAHSTVHQLKRPNAVGKIKDFRGAISRTARKSSLDKNSDSRNISQPMMIVSPSEPCENGLFVNPQRARPFDRRTGHSNLSLRRRKKRPYSRDDLDLFSIEKLKFWKPSSRIAEQQHTAREQVVSSIKTEHSQGSAIHLKSASVTLDKLLDSVDDDFSEKFVQWQTSSRSRAPSRASETISNYTNRGRRSHSSLGLPPTSINTKVKDRSYSDEKREVGRKDSFRKKLVEKLTSQKFSNRRSRSYDRIIVNSTKEVSRSHSEHSRSLSVSGDDRSSLSSGTPDLSNFTFPRNSRRNALQKHGVSAEWSGLQEAFPTNSKKLYQKTNGVSHVRLRPPLRRKNNLANRKTWAPTESTNSFFLPSTADFIHGNDFEIAGLMGDQLSLKLDPNDVQGIHAPGSLDKELKQLNKNTAEVQQKLQAIDKDEVAVKSKGKHQSSLAQYRAELGARFFRRSNRVEILRLNSCEVLATAQPVMSPVHEECETGNVSVSLPDLAQECMVCEEDSGEGNRRFTVTVIDLKSGSSGQIKKTQSTSNLLDKPPIHPMNALTSSVVQRSTSCRQLSENQNLKDSEQGQKWVINNLLNSRRNRASLSAESIAHRSSPFKSEQSKPIFIKKSKTDKVRSHLKKLSPKPRSRSLRVPRTSDIDDPASQSKKKSSKFFSFRKSPSKSKKQNSNESYQKNRPRAETESSIPLSSHSDSSHSNTLSDSFNSDALQKRSRRVVELSERFADDPVSSRNHSSPTPITKGLVSRLSKRFARADKKNDKKKTATSGATSKNINFLSAKSRFERRANSDSKTNLLLTKNTNHNNKLFINYR